ncbi:MULTISPECIES: hypothetical protein [Paenibacillus]|uniref:Uncharacterized protein n=1 Tax=Paenibacillus vini TaxID=1476024 RepID=A0ABQ4MF09_9BACL|nr:MULTISPECIES: hypothetical protein [Paenibacillus]MBQ4901115.1 hypothetical protein [Paenibacillus sp. Marseille-P2973]MDN4068152.1 hypothetical protein [Paenibacillus vini]GIP54566.1 hypothetical protein J42TS3_36010 [Paenibacillus vini]
MDHIELWILLFLAIVGLGWLSHKHRYSGKVRTAYRELKELAAKTRENKSVAGDLVLWESGLKELERHPNEYNLLDQEIGLRETFLTYLVKHYPQDGRLEQLRAATQYSKDDVWGMKVRR